MLYRVIESYLQKNFKLKNKPNLSFNLENSRFYLAPLK